MMKRSNSHSSNKKSKPMMLLFRFLALILPLFLLLLFIFHIPSANSEDPLYVVCDNTTSSTNSSTFGTNLRQLLSSLSSNSSLNNGFYNTSIGRDSNTTYGLTLCRGDVKPKACETCIKTAGDEILGRCRLHKSATIWYDNCFLRYSSNSFLGTPSTPVWKYMSNLQTISSDPDQFEKILVDLMNNLARRAANEPWLRMFATEDQLSSFWTIYGLVQCIRDISANECFACLADAIRQIPNCCDKKLVGRVFGAVCGIRYEVYSFFNASTIALPAPSPSPTTGKGKTKKSPIFIYILVPIVAAAVSLAVIIATVLISKICLGRKKDDTYTAVIDGLDESDEYIQIDFNTVKAATNDFSDQNKLGEGEFGPVYKGILPNGQEIAVKRLSLNSGQGAEEFRNEVALVAKLQHRHLVRLFGCCVEGEEKLLIYEYVPNRSLDCFIFDPSIRASLSWERRYKIIRGIAQGLLYLHEDLRLRIIHRDLKASNILLDADMNPKISDFGMAKIFGVDQTQGNTNRIAGTYGYMSPEYAMHGQFSVKSDVFSFGVLLLEIVSGKKNNPFSQSDGGRDLLSYAWRAWNNGTILDIIDSTVSEHCPRSEVLRCIHIGLLCVQEDATARPIMSSVVLMLDSSSITLAAPSAPAFYISSVMEPGFQIDYSSVANHSNRSPQKISTVSVNDVSITELEPR